MCFALNMSMYQTYSVVFNSIYLLFRLSVMIFFIFLVLYSQIFQRYYYSYPKYLLTIDENQMTALSSVFSLTSAVVSLTIVLCRDPRRIYVSVISVTVFTEFSVILVLVLFLFTSILLIFYLVFYLCSFKINSVVSICLHGYFTTFLFTTSSFISCRFQSSKQMRFRFHNLLLFKPLFSITLAND